MNKQVRQPLGVIEAFYGREWSMPVRQVMLANLGALGYQHYIYAPKSDRKLRAQWRQRWSVPELEQLHTMVGQGSCSGIAIGIGFSPLGLDKLDSAAERAALEDKVQQISELGISQLCILFDDMQASGKSMASNQLRIVDFICERSGVDAITVCPSYYSTDPVLEKLFGSRPENYWRELGQGLDGNVDIFWTGEQVCSKHYSRANLDFIANEFARLPTLWDNYPVNDGESMCQHLHLLPFAERYPWLCEYTAAHYANPMNQAHLSLLPLATLPAIYAAQSLPGASEQADGELEHRLHDAWHDCLASLPQRLASRLARDAEKFQTKGLNNFSMTDRQQWAEDYAAIESPWAVEVVDWLNGEYAFDPACLTD